MVVKVTFPSSACEYHYKVAPNVELQLARHIKLQTTVTHIITMSLLSTTPLRTIVGSHSSREGVRNH